MRHGMAAKLRMRKGKAVEVLISTRLETSHCI